MYLLCLAPHQHVGFMHDEHGPYRGVAAAQARDVPTLVPLYPCRILCGYLLPISINPCRAAGDRDDGN